MASNVASGMHMATAFEPKFDVARTEQMKQLLKLSTLPEDGVEPLDDSSEDLGVKLGWLKEAKTKLEDYDVKKLEGTLNTFQHFTSPVEDTIIHFVHERSPRPDAIPLIILHGWPGRLFFDFHKIIKTLANPDDPTQSAFHVVAPSLPGYAWSTLPRKKVFGLDDLARVFNKLMVEVLGYKEYVAQGGDWGSHILRFTGQNHSDNARLIHFNMFHGPAAGLASYVPWVDHLPIPQWVASSIKTVMENWGLSESEKQSLTRTNSFKKEGRGYTELQRTRPATIGYAVATSPVALLAYIGEKFLAWSDPATLNMDDLLATVTIYYLTSSFQTSVMIYQKCRPTRALLGDPAIWGKIKSQIAFSAFPYEIYAPPAVEIAKCGPLVQFKRHDKGGHFPALDNPAALVDDLREFAGAHWKKVSPLA
ncbi:alpha/beta-hydrolase [Clavulina sp. PMI_390]|nr:alpha/beta-hydrolase [Clavulina sp. PMI_390]